ncbi:MAG: CapA family protein, partial [Acidobacteriaceae bacterium]
MGRRNDLPVNGSRLSLVEIFMVVFLSAVSILTLAGCSLRRADSIPTINPLPVGLESSTSTPTITASSSPTSIPTQVPVSLWVAPYLPEKLSSALVLPDGYFLAADPAHADVTLDIAPADMPAAIQWMYALVAPFPTVPDNVTLEELRDAWSGSSAELFDGSPLLMDETTLDVFAGLWGSPAPRAVLVLPSAELIDYAWSNQPSWAIVPFELLDPHWKVLSVDGQSPVRKDFDPSSYTLNVPFTLSGSGPLTPEAFNLPLTNRDPSELTTVVMTGVTAMVRATAWTMEEKGVTYPAEDIGALLAQADITHISNEIPFAPDCPYPSTVMPSLVFCSDPKYIDLLKTVGTDIIELTGDHFMDYGADATLYSLKMYDDLGWPYYGGGADAEQAHQPVLLEHNGNKLAFLGCNIGCEVKTEIPCDAIATASHPGAAKCDFDWLSSEIPSLVGEGYQVLFTFQH